VPGVGPFAIAEQISIDVVNGLDGSRTSGLGGDVLVEQVGRVVCFRKAPGATLSVADVIEIIGEELVGIDWTGVIEVGAGVAVTTSELPQSVESKTVLEWIVIGSQPIVTDHGAAAERV